jgi:5-methylcytosine-specific restriction endonuclease McrA
MKRCCHCKVEKPLSEFCKNRSTKDGLSKVCRTCLYMYTSAWKKNNRDKVALQTERNQGTTERYYLAHREKILEWQKNYHHSHRAEESVWHRNRRSKKKASGEFTYAEFKQLCDRFGNVCLCCGMEKKLTPDHVIPLSRGGSNNIDNIQPLCFECNHRKRAKTIDYRL